MDTIGEEFGVTAIFLLDVEHLRAEKREKSQHSFFA